MREKMKDFSQPKFCYFRDGNGNVIATAWKLLSKSEDGILEVQYGQSACHPNDRFVKKVGRAKAQGRLEQRLLAGVETLKIKDDRNFGGLYKNVVAVLEKIVWQDAPNWWNKNPLTIKQEETYANYMNRNGYTIVSIELLNSLLNSFAPLFQPGQFASQPGEETCGNNCENCDCESATLGE
jgi:hypothetical protein